MDGKEEKFRVHDNGGRPFEVTVDRMKNTVAVAKLRDDADDDDDGLCCDESKWVYDPLMSWNYRQIWIGQGTMYPHEDQGQKTYGNTILLEPIESKMSARTTLVAVMHIIFSFQLQEEGEFVTRYVSRIGNNDVPYPYVETNKNVYLLLAQVYAPITQVQQLAADTAHEEDQKLNADFTRTKNITGLFHGKGGTASEETHPVTLDFYDLYYEKKNPNIWTEFNTFELQNRLV